jgi:hypothetical protein
MGDNRAEQKEALEILVGFNERLVVNMDILAEELSGHRLADTDKLLKSVVDATNWEIQVINGTMELLNDGKQRIDKESFNGKVVHLSEALKERNDGKTAEAIRELIPEFKNLQTAAKEAIAAA